MADRRRLLEVSRREFVRVDRILRAEFTAGLLVMAAALAGFIAANSPLASAFFALRETRIGPAALHLDLSIGQWASDGLLAVFFFVVGLELKRELTIGALRRMRTAIVPVAAAVGGVIAPALLYLAITGGGDAARGWAIPTATDIAFAVAVLGLIAPRIPPALRVFLLTLAVVDDLIAIGVIAIFYTAEVAIIPLLASLIVIACFGVVAWALMHASGVHATVAGVLLGFAVPVALGTASGRSPTPTPAPLPAPLPAVVPHDRGADLAGRLAHRFTPLSSGIAVPVFAFFAAGVTVGGAGAFLDPIAIGVVVGLVVGKPLGIVLTTWTITRFTRAELGAVRAGGRWWASDASAASASPSRCSSPSSACRMPKPRTRPASR